MRRLVIRSYRDVPPPVVILGMHRSGTSMLTGMLRDCGLYAGGRLDAWNEARYFRQINVKLLEHAGATWTELEPYLDQRSLPGFHRESCEWVRRQLDRNFLESFLGFERPVAPFWRPIPPWGWKDPRTCVTASVWREVFPEARWLHIARHPLDVAISLQRREQQRQREGMEPVPVSLDLEHNLQLWEVHAADALALRSEGVRYREVRYEELVQDPVSGLAAIVRFCGLAPAREAVMAAAAGVDATRTQRYDGPDFRPWLERIAGLPSAAALGYA